jgi:hypothetical protein
MPEQRKPRHFAQWAREEQQRAFYVWLPKDLHEAPGIDWTLLPDVVMGYCVTSIGATPDAPYLALVAASAREALSANSLFQLLLHMHAILTILRTVCGMERVSDLQEGALWNEFAAKTQATLTRSRQLSAYSAVSTKHFPRYLRELERDDYDRMRQYQLPPLPGGFLGRVGKAGELNERSRLRQQQIHATLLPLFPGLRQLVWLRKQVAQRLLEAYHQAQGQAAAGAMIPLAFRYTDVLPWMHQRGQTAELRQRELHLRFILWTRRDWILEHKDRYSKQLVRKAESAEGIYASHRDRYFVQFDCPLSDLLWFGTLVSQRLMQNLHDSPQYEPLYWQRLHIAEALGFSYGCYTSRSGLLQPDAHLAVWFARHTRVGDLLFEPEALYRGVLYGAALATLALTSRGSVSELLQISAERWVMTAEGRQQWLLPDRARNDDERRLFTIGPLAAQLLTEIEQALTSAYGEIPQVAATRQNSKFDRMQTERYFFQWRHGMLQPRDTEVLLRFLLHDVNLATAKGTPVRISMEQLRHRGNISQEERAQQLLRAFGFNQTILPHLSRSSRDAYGRDFFAYWQFAGTKDAALQHETLERWIAHMQGKRYQQATIYRGLHAVQHIFAAAAEKGYIDQGIADSFRRIEQAHPVQPPAPGEKHTAPDVTFRALFKKCGKPSCSTCKDKGHGPYWYLTWNERGKGHSIYVGREKDEESMARALQRFEQLRATHSAGTGESRAY